MITKATITRSICSLLPPIIAQRVRNILYKQDDAFKQPGSFYRRARTGSLFYGKWADFHSYKFAIHGFFDWRNWAVAMALCKNGDTIVEVGANVGTETVGFRDIVGKRGKVFAFEPLPDNLGLLEKIKEINHWENVHILPHAVGNQSGPVCFSIPPRDEYSGVGFVSSKGSTGIKVDCITLNSIFERLGHVNAIFADIEGFEVNMLQGATKIIETCRPVLILEVSAKHLKRAGKSIEELESFLLEFDYTYRVIDRLKVVVRTEVHDLHTNNWICLPREREEDFHRISKFIFQCAVLPCMRGINPLCQNWSNV